jgi:hypothetical protein
MLCEQIEEEKGKTANERVLSEDGEPEFSFSDRVKIRGLKVTDIQTFVATWRSGDALSDCGSIVFTSKYAENASYFGRGVGKIQDRGISWPRAIHFHIKEHMRMRWH